jgi:hypothetical protein
MAGTSPFLPYGHTYYISSDSTKVAAWRAQLKDIEQKLKAGIPVFVSFKDVRRKDSIACIKTLVWEENIQRVYKRGSFSSSSRYEDVSVPEVKEITIGWDDRSKTVSPKLDDFYLEPNHDPALGTKYVWEQTAKPKAPKKVVLDSIGEPVNVGDFVSFVYRSYGHIDLKFGTVTRMTDKGTVFVQTLKIKDGQRAEELRCHQDNLVIVNNQLMNRLTMAKLAAN